MRRANWSPASRHLDADGLIDIDRRPDNELGRQDGLRDVKRAWGSKT